jgi:hypothetical protein
MKNYLVAALLFLFFQSASGQGILNSPDTKGFPAIEFTGAYLGFQARHDSVEPLWLDYDRVIVVSSGIKWRRYIEVGGEFGVPVYRTNGMPRRSYILVRVDLRLL